MIDATPTNSWEDARPPTAEDWEAYFWKSLHPIKIAVIEALHFVDIPLSPVGIHRLFPHGNSPKLSLVAYHVKKLAADPLPILEVVDEIPARGPVEHFYYWRAE